VDVEAWAVNVPVSFRAPPTVHDFMSSDERVRLIVGPIGSGKSSGCNMEILRRAVEQKPGPDGKRRTRFAVIRNTYRELKDTTRKTFEQWFAPLIERGYGVWREQDFTFVLNMGEVECEVLFRALDRAEDVKKLLSLELTGGYINEAREVPVSILAGLRGRIGRFPSVAQGGCTWKGIWMDTNPMHTGHELYRLFKLEKPEGHALFEQPSGLSPEAENIENLPPGYYTDVCQGQDEEWVDEYVRSKYPNRNKGSVYGEQLAKLDEVQAIGHDFHHPTDGIFIHFDLGVSDATAMWWWRPNGAGGVDFLDYYEATGQGLTHFIDEAHKREEQRGWEYVRLVLPHDARNRVLTGTTVFEQLSEAYEGKVDVLPNISLEDGLSATRWLLERLCRFHPRCVQGVKALREYKYQFDLDRRVYSRKPVHDWTSHGADAARYVALYAKRGELLARKAPEPANRGPRTIHDFKLDEFYELAKQPARSNRI
jgi:hypothetical protein